MQQQLLRRSEDLAHCLWMLCSEHKQLFDVRRLVCTMQNGAIMPLCTIKIDIKRPDFPNTAMLQLTDLFSSSE